MRTQDWIRFFTLCALWGMSFVFIRTCAPVLGPGLTAGARLGIAGIALVGYLRLRRIDGRWREHRWLYFRVGMIACAIPFVSFATGALWLSASLLSIINACTPLFGAVFAAIWLQERFTLRRGLGVALGFTGVALANGMGNIELTSMTMLGIACATVAPLCYGLAGVFIKLKASFLPPEGNAAFSQLAVAPLVLLTVPIAPPTAWPSGLVVGALLALALSSSALAYVLFYRLMGDIGPTRVTTITFVIPIFGMLWGYLLLDEKITAGMLFGCAIMLAGTWLVVQQPKPANDDRSSLLIEKDAAEST